MSKEIITLCNQALDAFREHLPTALYEEAYTMINEYNEWGLAIEFVIDWIGELEFKITAKQFYHIEAAMMAMGWEDSDRMVWLRKYRTALGL